MMKKSCLKSMAVIIAACLLTLSGCGKSDGNSAGSSLDTFNNAVDEYKNDENAFLDDPVDHEKSPFVITVTDKDTIYIEIKKEIYDPSKVDYAYFAEFYDEAGEKKLAMDITGGDFSQARLMYGDPGDTKTTAVSDYDPEDKGDSYLYTDYLKRPEQDHFRRG